jgi:hypothetical protein
VSVNDGKAFWVTTDLLKILGEILDRVDNTLCNTSREDPRFRQFLALSEEINRMVGKLGLWWKEYTAPVKTDEEKVAFNIERIRELVQKLPEKLAEKINRLLPKTPDTPIHRVRPAHVHPT